MRKLPVRRLSIAEFAAVVGMMVVLPTTTVAQDVVWPVPGRAPDILVGAEYGIEAFDEVYRPMHQGEVFGGIRNASGSYLLKLVAGKRFGKSGMQAELESYPLLADRLYAYLSYAYGETPVFPRHRLGLEVFKGLPSGFEASLGTRAFSFPEGESIVLATGSIAYYFQNLIFSFRPFLSVNAPRTGFSGLIQARYYLSENEEFVFGRVGAGFTPDERWIQSSQGIPGTELTLLQSQAAGAGIQSLVATKLMVTGRLDITRQEIAFRPGAYVLDFSLGCGIKAIL